MCSRARAHTREPIVGLDLEIWTPEKIRLSPSS